MNKPWQALHHLTTWHVRSVERSRANAMVAATALAGRRAEREEVAEFLERYLEAHPESPRSRSLPTGTLSA